MKSSTLVRLLCLFSAVLLAWPLAGSMAQRVQKTDPSPVLPGTQQIGSVLIYNFYNSDSSQKDVDTTLTLTNTNPKEAATVHLFFVRQPGCGVSDTYLCVTAGATVKVRASDYDPKGSGYAVAVAVDKTTGQPLGFNYLTGSEDVRTADGHGGALNAFAVKANFEGTLQGTKKAAESAALVFDGSTTGYAQLPAVLTLDKVASPADGNDSILVVNRIGGNLAKQGAPIEAVSGLVSNSGGSKVSFQSKVESCQLQSPLAKLLPDSKAAIPSGQTGEIELSDAAGEGGFVGAVLNANNRSQSFSGARNFDSKAVSASVRLEIPVGAAPDACRALAADGADLELTMSGNPALSVVRGTNITYTLSSKNKGFDSAFNVVIRDSLPTSLTYVSATPSSGGSCFVPDVGENGTVDCTWAGTSGLLVTRSVVIVAKVDETLPSGSEIVNIGETYSSINDPNESNNTRIVRTTVTADSTELVIATQSLPFGKIGIPYSATLVAVNGTAPLIWSITGGVLPDGLLLNSSTGVISGTPTQTGLFPITFRVLDSSFRIAQKSYFLQVVSQFRAIKNDFDGDGKADLAVWRGNESKWLIINSSDGILRTVLWGASYAPYNDVPATGDYDGDGKTDVAVWRPLDGNWYIINSSDNSIRVEALGVSGDTPVPGDYDGDGKTDIAVWRGSNTNWYIKLSSNGTTQEVSWGASYAPYFDTPVPADYDGDGRTDIAVWRGNTSAWYIKRSSDGATQQVLWGTSNDPHNDTPVPADYDGDGKADVTIWRGNVSKWYGIRSSNGSLLDATWGASYSPYFDIPVPSDYDGDGKSDVAVWRSSTGFWYALRSTDGTTLSQQHGQTGDTPILR